MSTLMTELPEPLVPADCGLPRTRARAMETRSTLYLSGEACPKGHVGARYTLNGSCVECQRQWTRDNRARIRRLRVDHA
jgi:hypothetical protein